MSIKTRQNFPETWLWDSVTTDDNGDASVKGKSEISCSVFFDDFLISRTNSNRTFRVEK